MPRFFFDTEDGDAFIKDEDGIECDNVQKAHDLAMTWLPDIAKDKMPDGEVRDFIVTVRNESGRAVYEAKLGLRGRWLSDNDA